MPFGPMQMLVLTYEGSEPSPEVAAELKRLREQDIVRLVDLLLVSKAEDGTIAPSRRATCRPTSTPSWARSPAR